MEGRGDGSFRDGGDRGDGGSGEGRGLKRKDGGDGGGGGFRDCDENKRRQIIEIFLPCIRCFSSQSEDAITLGEYVKNMKPEQKDVYFIDAASVTRSFLEKLAEKNIGVLFLVDPIHEAAIQVLKSYKDKNFVRMSKEDLGLGDKDEDRDKDMKQEFGRTCDWIKKRLGERIGSVQVSIRLKTSPCVLAYDESGCSADRESLTNAPNVGDTSSIDFMEVFEINLEHPIIRSLNDACKSNPNDEEALKAIDLLYATALFSSGIDPESPCRVCRKDL